MRTRYLAGAAVITAALVAGAVALPGASANASPTYEAFARANLSELTIENPSIPTGIAIEGGGPSAQARQDSLGTRDANAQFPYAGDSVPGLPGTGAALFGFPAPPYPFQALTNAGSAPSTVGYPGLRLRAESGDFTTLANGTIGEPSSLGAESIARIDEARNGDVTVTASTVASGLDLGPYGTLSNVETVATVIANSITGSLTRSSNTSIGRISVPGLNIDIPAETPGAVPIPIPIPGVPNQDPLIFPPFPVPAGGTSLHDPDIGIQNGFFTVTQFSDGTRQTYIIPTESGLAAFKAAGVTISFQAPEELAGGIIAGTYRFAWTAPAPAENTYYNGETKFTQATGLVLANVNLQPAQDYAGFPGATDGAELPGASLPGGVDSIGAGLLPNTDTGAVTGVVPGADTVSLSAQPGIGGLGGAGDTPDLFLVAILVFIGGFIATAAVSALGVKS